jgi:ribosome assembly protein YihI (activator of Der GTPase)
MGTKEKLLKVIIDKVTNQCKTVEDVKLLLKNELNMLENNGEMMFF